MHVPLECLPVFQKKGSKLPGEEIPGNLRSGFTYRKITCQAS